MNEERFKAFPTDVAQKFRDLRSKLLALGGEEVVIFPYGDPDLDNVLEHGRVFKKTYKKVRGEPSRCHYNVRQQFIKHPNKYRPATGYALTSDDGLWRQHSWLLDTQGRTVETTTPRDLYFGICITTDAK
jgi:hypothetical protein